MNRKKKYSLPRRGEKKIKGKNKGINIFDSPENLRMSTENVSSPSVSAGLTFSCSRRFRLMEKPALTLGLLTPA
jgi:hypothetical protein